MDGKLDKFRLAQSSQSREKKSVFEEIDQRINGAATKNQNMAMFHYQVLRHAHQLANVDPVEFCRAVHVHESYATEFRKMLSLARLLQQEGTRLS